MGEWEFVVCHEKGGNRLAKQQNRSEGLLPSASRRTEKGKIKGKIRK